MQQVSAIERIVSLAQQETPAEPVFSQVCSASCEKMRSRKVGDEGLEPPTLSV